MANTIVLKRSATPAKVPTTAQLALGEIAINTYDGLIYIKKDNGTASVVQIGGVTSVNGETGSVTIDTGDVTENGNLYFTNARARSAVSAGSGISYNSGTGAISTTQTLTTAGSPTFAGLTLTGGIPSIAGSIIPSADVTYDLGSPAKQWKDIYVGPGSLYVNGQKVLQDDSGTITFSADVDENIRIKTLGTGILQLGSSTSTIQVDSTLQISAGKNITDSAGIKVNFGDNIEMNGNKVIGLGAPSSANDAATKTYVDTSISAISTSSITQGNSNVTVTDSGTGTVTVTVDGSTALTVDATGVVVAGNFTVSGTTTSVNSNTISLADNIITLNSDATGAPTQNAGIEVERGDEANVQLRWNEGSGKWTFTNNGAVYYPMAVGTDDLAEGSTNQYFTNTRARGALSGSSGTGLSYNSGTGTFSLGSIPNSSLTNSSVTIGSTSTALGATSTTLAGLTSVTSTGFTGALTGNASTATTLATARAIQGVSFDGSAAITVVTAGTGITVTGTAVAIDSTVATLTGTQTLTNKTLTSPTINAATIGGHLIPSADVTYDLGSESFRFRDLFLSGSTIKLGSATLQASGTGLSMASTVLKGSTSGTVTLTAPAVAGTTAISFPATAGTVVTTGDSGTVTSTMIANGTIVDADINASAAIANSKLANSAVTVTAGTGLSGGGSVSLGGSITLTNTITQYTDALARAAVSFTAGSGAYNSTTGVITIPTNTNQLTNGASFATTSYVDSAVQAKDNTDEITEGSTNLFFTNARARGAVSAGTGISYNSATGAITNTITQYTDALARAAVSFTAGSGAYNSTTGVITIPTNNNQLTNGSSYITLASLSGGTGISYNSSTGAITNSLSTSGGSIGGAIAVSGAITATGEVTAYFSDLRLKTNIVPIADALAKVEAINGVTFDPNEAALALGIDARHQMGVIAQEVEAVAPELVCDSAFAGYKTVRYDKLTALLIEAVKELSAKVTTLEAQLGNAKPTL